MGADLDPPADTTTADPARERRRTLWVAVLFTALTIFFSYPLPFRMSTELLGSGTDPDLWMWTLAWDTHAFVHQPFSIFDANIFFPVKHALAYSENLIGSAFLAAPILWLSNNHVLTLNLVTLISAALCAIGAYVLGRRLGLGQAGAIVAGLIFGFAPARFMRIEQLHVGTVQWVPFALAYLHSYFQHGRARDMRLFLAFLSLQALTSGHGAAFLIVAAVAFIAWKLLLGEPLALKKRVADFGVIGALLLLPSVLLFAAYRAARAEVPDLQRVLDDFGVSISSYFASPSHVQALVLAHAPQWFTTPPPDAWLFPGYLPVLLAVAAVVIRTSNRDRHAPGVPRLGWRARLDGVVPFYVLVTLVSFWLTLGPPIGLWRWVYWLPVFNFLRVPSRFVVLEMLGLAVLAGFGVERIGHRVAPARRTRAALIAGALLVVEFAAIPLETTPYEVKVPAIDAWLNDQPKPFAVAEVPLPDSLSAVTEGQRNTLYMLHSMGHWQKTVHGFSGVEPALYTKLYWQIARFPDPESLASLTDLGVKYIVMHPKLYPPAELVDAEKRFLQFKDWLTLEHVEADGRVYSLKRPR